MRKIPKPGLGIMRADHPDGRFTWETIICQPPLKTWPTQVKVLHKVQLLFLAIFHDRFSITGLVFSGRHVMAVKENAQVWILEQ